MTTKSECLYDPYIGAKLFNVKEAAAYLKYHPVSIWRLVSEKTIKPYRKAGKTLLFMKEDLDRFRLTSTWAARKAAIDKTSELPKKPPVHLEVTISLDLGLGLAFRQPMEPIKGFAWDKIPLIRAKIDSKYGNVPFEISIKSPDGGLWSVSYEPPTWIEKVWKKLHPKGRGERK